MQFQVPQFIDIEDKIFGPLTLKQFLYLAGAGALSFTLFFMFQTWLWLVITIILGIFALALAFGKYNGQNMLKTMSSGIKYLWLPKLYLWQYVAAPKPELVIRMPKPAAASSPLKSLLLRLNTSGGPALTRPAAIPSSRPAGR